MTRVIPVIIRLEIQKGAPLVDFNCSGLLGIELRRCLKRMSVPNKARIKTSTPSAEMLDTGDAPRRPPGHGCSSRSSAIPPPIKCVDHRKYADVVVQTFTNPGTASSSKHIPTASSSNHLDSLHRAASGSSVISNALRDFDSLSFFSGNPCVEKTTGIIHFYKRTDMEHVDIEDCLMLCMVAIPAFIRCQELLKFISPYSSYIRELRVVQGVAANQYMVIIRFKTHADLWHFYDDCEGTSYNGIEPDRCSLLFVQKLETVGEAESINPWIEGLKELPTCPVCLERLDDQTITILCNHTFHPTCLEQWSDTTCPVCRYCLTPEVTPSLKCSDCDRRTDLWICLICGNIGCGRYAEAHAYQHFETTSHTYTKQINGEQVWDYAGDNYVHRLIQTGGDGKVIEYQRNAADSTAPVRGDEKIESIQLEYTVLLTNQLESQRIFFENKLKEMERKYEKAGAILKIQVEELESKLKKVTVECESLKKELTSASHGKQAAEKKLQTTQSKLNKTVSELDEERSINALLRADQEEWANKVTSYEREVNEMRDKYSAEVNELNEQVRDLLMHFEAQNKFKESLASEKVSQDELEEGKIVIGDAQPSPGKSKRRSKK